MHNILRLSRNKYKTPLRKAFFLLFFYLSFFSLHAQHTPLYFRHLTVEDGLGSNTVHSIIQDSVGFMWFGTNAGLERYDGYEFKTILIDSHYEEKVKVFTILEDWNKEPFFWLGTSEGLYAYYPSSDTAVKQDIPGKSKRIKNIVKIVKDFKGLLWLVGTSYLKRFNPVTGEIRTFTRIPGDPESLPSPEIRTIFEDSFHKLWVGTKNGLAFYDRKNDNFSKKMPFTLVKHHKGLNQINSIQEDGKGNLWILSWKHGLLKYNRDEDKFVNYSRNLQSLSYNSRNLLVDNNGFLWLASSRGGGLTKFDPKTELFEYYKYSNADPNSLSSNFLNCIFQDKQGVIWIGTKHKGIERFAGNSVFFVNYQNELYKGNRSLRKIKTILREDNDLIWAGMNKRDLLKIDTHTLNIKKYSIPVLKGDRAKSSIYTIHKVNPSFFILGLINYGLIRYNPVSEKFTPLLQNIPQEKGRLSVFTGIQDKNGILWYGLFRTGVLRFNPKTLAYKYCPTSTSEKTKNRVLSLIQTSNGALLAATQNSRILKYNIKNDRFEDYYVFEKKVQIRDLYKDASNRLWMATNHGLYMLEIKTGAVSHFNYKQGISSNVLNCITPDDAGKLWLSFNDGLICFDPETRMGNTFDYISGIASISFRQNVSFKSKDGVLLFGGTGGFTLVKPDSNLFYKLPSIMFSKSEIYVNNYNDNDKGLFKQNFTGNNQLELPYDNYGFLFEFSLNDFESPFRSHYQYKLEGGAGHWQDLGRRHSISFVSLSPGKYKLHVKGQNAQGLWSRNELVAEFEILPPFWQTWWFRSWTVFLLLLVIVLGYQIRVYAIRRRNAELEELNKKLNNQIMTRRQIERMLTENEIKYRTLVEGIGDGIYTLNAAGVFHFMNKIAAARMGGKPSDFSGHSIYEYYPDKVVKPLMLLVNKVIKDGNSREIDAEIEVNGAMKNFNVGIHPLKNERGEITLTLHIAVDTSERVKLEEQLRQAQKMEAVGNLAGGIAHDFNNLLSVIRGYSFLLLQEEKLEDSIYKSIKEIDMAGERAQNLTRQLLAFSRKQMLKPKVMNLNTHINEIKTMLKRLIPENIEVKFELDSELNHIFADPGQMEQVIMNLMVNARDAMPVGGCLTIKTANALLPQKLVNKDEDNNMFISISVTDTGIGMTKEVQQKIFDPFFTTKETGKGTGLGLSTVFGIVKQSEGYVWVESVYKKGSTFFVYLPAVNKTVIAEETTEAKEDFPQGHETILVVEDEASVRKMIVKMLNLYGYTVLEANDGWKGLSLYEQNRDSIDLILTDVVMPGISGVELIKKVHTINAQQKVIYMSGYTDNEIVQSGIVRRGIHFLQKPFAPEALMNALGELCSANNPVSM